MAVSSGYRLNHQPIKTSQLAAQAQVPGSGYRLNHQPIKTLWMVVTTGVSFCSGYRLNHQPIKTLPASFRSEIEPFRIPAESPAD